MPALPQTIISGVAYDEQGNVAPGVRLKVIKAIKSGSVIKLQPRTIATSNASGVFERSTGVPDFLLPRNSTVWLSGNFQNGATSFKSDNGISVAIPDAGTATLEGLGAGAVVPVQGVTVQSNGTPTANLISIFNFTTGLTAVESPTGTVTVAVTPTSVPVSSVFGRIGAVVAANNDYAFSQISGAVADGQLSANVTLGANSFSGTGAILRQGTPTLTTPVLGVASATSINKWVFTAPTTAATLTAGADNCTYTFPATSATLARTDAANIFTGNQQFNNLIQMAGTTSAFPAIKRNSTAVNFRLADDSADAPITAGNITSSNIMQAAQVQSAAVDGFRLAQSGSGWQLSSNLQLQWAATAAYNGTIDTTLSRAAANTLQVGTTAANALGHLKAASLRGNAVAFASVPASPVEGMLVAVTDSSTATWGATITGGGANHVLAYYNGTNWKVACA